MYSGGYAGKILRINLTEKTFKGRETTSRGGQGFYRRRWIRNQVSL